MRALPARLGATHQGPLAASLPVLQVAVLGPSAGERQVIPPHHARCSGCEFAKPTAYPEGTGRPPDDELLQCHRFPPIALTHQSAAFAKVSADDWCGEYRSNGKTQP